MKMMILGVGIADILLFVVLLAVVCKPAWKKYYLLVKTANSVGFLSLLFVGLVVSEAVHQFWLMLPGFVCCLAGDVFMACYNLHRKKIHFLMGLGTFLLAHICLVRWLCVRQPLQVRDIMIPILAVLFTWGMTNSKKIHTGRLRPFIIAYAFFVASLFAKGISVLNAEMNISGCMVASGAAMFLVSDISILFLYFYKGKYKAIHAFNLTTYYGAMYLLAGSLFVL